MKINKVAVALWIAAFNGAPAMWAQERFVASDRSASIYCETDTLKGRYALTISGSRPAPTVLPAFPGVTPGTIEQVTGVFILIFDGNGEFRMGDTITVKGSLSGLFPDQPGTGTYTVNPDCSGTFKVNLPQLPAPLVNNMVIFNGGKEFRSVVTSPQALMISVAGVQVNGAVSATGR